MGGERFSSGPGLQCTSVSGNVDPGLLSRMTIFCYLFWSECFSTGGSTWNLASGLARFKLGCRHHLVCRSALLVSSMHGRTRNSHLQVHMHCLTRALLPFSGMYGPVSVVCSSCPSIAEEIDDIGPQAAPGASDVVFAFVQSVGLGTCGPFPEAGVSSRIVFVDGRGA